MSEQGVTGGNDVLNDVLAPFTCVSVVRSVIKEWWGWASRQRTEERDKVREIIHIELSSVLSKWQEKTENGGKEEVSKMESKDDIERKSGHWYKRRSLLREKKS